MLSSSAAKFFNVLEFGAVPDGLTLTTPCLQKAVDAAADAGGGTVLIPPGTFLSGMIRLRSRVTLHLDPGAVLLASTDPENSYPPAPSRQSGDYWQHEEEGSWHLLYAENCEDVMLSGSGRIDGQGSHHTHAPPKDQLGWSRPVHPDGRRPGALVQITNCQRVRIRDIRLGNVANWTLHLFNSRHVHLDNIHIENPPEAPNSDGIDITGCHSVTVTGCHIDTGDDAICLKTFDHSHTCENITITNCVLRTHCVGLKMGCVESVRDMRNVTFSNCVISGSSRAIGLYSIRGATIENVAISNIVCDTKAPLMFTRPIHLDLRHNKGPGGPGAIRNVRIGGLLAETNGRCLFTGTEGRKIENLVLRDIVLYYPTVDDPALCGDRYGGFQFSPDSPWGRTARAAFIFDGVENLTFEGAHIQWPRPNSELDPAWSPPAKLANGDHRIFEPRDWQLSPELPFAAAAFQNCQKVQWSPGHLSGFQDGPVVLEE